MHCLTKQENKTSIEKGLSIEQLLQTENQELGNRAHISDQAGQIQETERNNRENVGEVEASA